jgi:hypothetical protein
MLFKPFAVIDAVMLVLFWMAYTGKLTNGDAPQSTSA